VAEELAAADPPLLLDIRNPREWSSKHIDGSVNVPLNHLQERIAEIPRDRRIAVHCAADTALPSPPVFCTTTDHQSDRDGGGWLLGCGETPGNFEG